MLSVHFLVHLSLLFHVVFPVIAHGMSVCTGSLCVGSVIISMFLMENQLNIFEKNLVNKSLGH